ncbi:uncharacterized protein LOC142220180 [Haematobia irritans]|uniref:uncharacterized protein LOC142220180 n=1 Tax=Haematobia irritans TaxID=7368 RepID=UPI003F4F9E7D
MGESCSWQAPQWLNENYLEKILKKYLQDDTLTITAIELKPATVNGENYASVMTRIQIVYQTSMNDQPQRLSFIMKCAFGDESSGASIMADYDIYNTEMKIYEQVLPKMDEILQEIGINEQLFAKTLKVDYERSTIMFEDLTSKDYTLADRLKGLDRIHTDMVIEKLAKFHAAAAVLNERLHGDLEKFDRGLFNKYSRKLGKMYEYFTEANAESIVKNDPNLGCYFYDKLMQVKPHVVEYATKAYVDNSPGDFLTLCHGDFWVNNIMMKYNREEGHLEDLLFVDFQFSNWSSPAIDLYSLFCNSLEPSLTWNFQAHDEMLQLYHSVLKEMLQKLGYLKPIPSLHDLQQQFVKRKFLILTGILTDHAIVTSDLSEDADLNCLVGSTEKSMRFRENCCKCERHRSVIQVMLPYMDRCGLFDIQK